MRRVKSFAVAAIAAATITLVTAAPALATDPIAACTEDYSYNHNSAAQTCTIDPPEGTEFQLVIQCGGDGPIARGPWRGSGGTSSVGCPASGLTITDAYPEFRKLADA